jgi:DNA-binding PadR family transcriptional regulator
MVAISQTDMAILGMLTVEPMSGYDMKRFCEKSLVHFWHESYGNLYPRLRRLAAAGLVAYRTAIRERAPNAKVYKLTTLGRRRFLKWLQEPPEVERIRNELVLKLFFGAKAAPGFGVAMLEDHLHHLVKTREGYQALDETLIALPIAKATKTYWRIALRRGQLLTEARIRWCQESLPLLQKHHGGQEVA